MRIAVLAVGRLKSGPESRMVADYMKRAEGLGRAAGLREVKVVEVDESNAAGAARRKAEEAKAMAAVVPPGAYRIALDGKGREAGSRDFAALLRRHLDGGTQTIAFLVGGPDGHDPSILALADHVLSLGDMTWPHRLARVMLSEQIYRAVTILVNHPYHRP